MSLKRVAFHTLGCKLNYTETSMLWQQLHGEGYEKVGFEDAADVYVINTCSVTDNADKECRRIVRKALHSNENAKVVVTGCYAQLKPDEIASINGVSTVIGAQDKFRLADILNEIETDSHQVVYSCDINDVVTYKASYSVGERTRAFLKVQDGCNYSCTYCTIPLARGKSRSDTISNIVQQAIDISHQGVKEIVLSGVNIGDFGYSNGLERRQETLLQLIQALENVDGIERFRISSIEPNLLNNAIIDLVAKSNRFVPHFHIPMQSGSDTVLKLMKRRYLTKLYRERIEHIKSVMPHACIGADVIVGFPGETEIEFAETVAFLESLPLSYLHVFTYSERDNTAAISFDNVVPYAIRHQRNKILRNVSEQKRDAFYRKHLNSVRSVLWEGENDGDYMHGYTDNYIRVRSNYDSASVNNVTPVLLQKIDNDEVVGSMSSAVHQAV